MNTPDLTVLATRVHARFRDPLGAEDLKALVTRTTSGISLGCAEAGASLIGHIKCYGEADGGQHLRCSVVSQDGAADCRGEISGQSESLMLLLNTLVYGLKEGRVEQIVNHILGREIGGLASRMVIENPGQTLEIGDLRAGPHPHSHDHEPG